MRKDDLGSEEESELLFQYLNCKYTYIVDTVLKFAPDFKIT